MALTGRFDFRRTWTGRIMLRVEEEVPALWSRSGERPMKKRWRNATLMDLTTPEMRMLMDLRMRPHLLHQAEVEVDRTAFSSTKIVPLHGSGASTRIPEGEPSTPARATH